MTPERYEQIGQLYQKALELEPGKRGAFLAEACASDETLRREVEGLLAAHEAVGDFIEQPPNDVAAGWQAAARNLPAQRIGHYELQSLLGKGGMGEVWLADDTQLHRQVAVKLLPLEFTADAERVRRFAQEARAASALNHPNIITIHEIGHEIGQAVNTHYLVTEYVAGETLRQRLTNAPQQRLPLAEALALATQIAEALAAAHAAGITHRDIKPENVMVRRDGYVKVLDFGLAKLTERAAPPVAAEAAEAAAETATADSSTAAGILLGTPRYMSPEQARGEKVDARTDIFSLGVLLYEMVAGRPPFTGATTREIIAAILRDEPPPLPNREAPPALEQIIRRTLGKDRAERYQTAADLRRDLQALQEERAFAVQLERTRRAPRGKPSQMLTWLAACAGLVIFALAAWLYFNRAPTLTGPALTEKDTILLADFDNQMGEESFSAMLKQGLAIQLQQTPFLTLLPEAQMRRQLILMRRPAHERVTAELAREICVRENLKAFITGSLTPLGSQYVITLAAFNGQSGEELARVQEQAASKEQLLRSLAQAAPGLREKLGESLSSIQRFNVLPQEGTTAKPEAFKAYAQGYELAVGGRLREAIPFFQHAIELDPDFGHAYSQLAIMFGLTGQPEVAVEYAEKAYGLKERANELEKFRITHYYHRFATGNLPKQIETLTLQRRTYPREYTGPNDLAVAYIQSGQFEQALLEARESMRLNPNFAAPHRWLAVTLMRLNRFAEAKDTLAQALQQKIQLPDFPGLFYQLAFLEGDAAGMRQQLEQARGKPDEYHAFDWQAQAAAFAGQWRQSQASTRRANDLANRAGMKELAAHYTAEQALRGALFSACQQAKSGAAQSLQFFRSRLALPRAALALALCGEVKQTQALAEELGKRYAEDTLINAVWLPTIRAALALQQGKAALALQQLQSTNRYEPAAEFWPQYLRGQAYLQLKQNTKAAAEFQKILDHRGEAPLSSLYPLAQLGLARATHNRQAYDEFFAKWKDADTDLPVLIEAKRTYAEK